MAVIKAVNSKASIGKAVNYITKDEKTEQKLIYGKDCNPHTAIDEMKATKEQWDKTEGRQYKHYVQSFNPEDNVTPEMAHSIGNKFLEDEKFKGHEVVMATHTDKGHVHNHFIVNSVNFETGKKYQERKQDLEYLKQKSNDLSREHGLSVPERGEEITSFKMSKYKSLEKAVSGEYKSHILDCYNTVSAVKEQAVNRSDFVGKMREHGYETSWSDNRKHITFEDMNGNKIRNSNLEKTFKEPFGKEDLERGFESNHQAERIRNSAKEQSRRLEDNSRLDGKTLSIGADHSDHEIGNTDALIEKLHSSIRDAKDAVSLDDSDRNDRITKEQSVERERNRGREQKTVERGSKGFDFER